MLSLDSPDRVPVDEIAEAAGISRGLLFHYFPTKRDFYVAVASEAARRLLEVTEPDPSVHHMERLHASLSAYVDYVADNEALYIALVRGASGSDKELQAISEETRAESARRVIAVRGPIGEAGRAAPPRRGVRALCRESLAPGERRPGGGWAAPPEESALDWL